MSEQRPTPETDSAQHANRWECYPACDMVDADFARKLECERDEAREELKAMREAIKNANHVASIILAEAGKQWQATEPLPDVASIEAVAQQIKDELQPFFKP